MTEDESMAKNQIPAKRISGDPVAGTEDSTKNAGKLKKIVGGGTLHQPIEFAEESAGSRSLKSDKSPISEKDKTTDNGQGGQDEPRVQISSNVKAVSYEDESGIKYPSGGQFYASTSPSSTPDGSLPMDELAMKSRGLVDSTGHHKRAYHEDLIWKDKISAYPFTPGAVMPCDDVKLRNQEKHSGPTNGGPPSIDQDLLEKDLPPLITVEDDVKAFDLSSEEKSSQKQGLVPGRDSSNKSQENPDLFTGGEIFAKKARARIRIKGRVRVRSHGRKDK